MECLAFSFKNIARIQNLGGFDKLCKLQLDNNGITTIENISHLVSGSQQQELCTSVRNGASAKLCSCMYQWCRPDPGCHQHPVATDSSSSRRQQEAQQPAVAGVQR